jgi:ACDE family multidrug resistance protein
MKSVLRQPRAVLALAFACVIAFMGLGLVDPILPAISRELHASRSQVELLFTSYFAVTGAAMLLTSWVSSRLGILRTLLAGLLVIAVFSALAGTAGSIGGIVGYRAGWGLGNALFIATALSAIVGAASGGAAVAIVLYEAALGLGISVGPLLGGYLGGISWRGPFFGVATLMVVAFAALFARLEESERPVRHSSLLDPLRALRHPGLLTMALTALFYNFGFFIVLGYAPFPLHLSVHELGLVFTGWGVVLALGAIYAAPRLQARFGTVRTMTAALVLIALDALAMGLWTSERSAMVAALVVGGVFLGINNTVVTAGVIRVAPVERSIASASYNFLRFGGAAIAPWLAGKLAERFGAEIPFYLAAASVAISVCVLLLRRSHLRTIDTERPAELAAPANARTALPRPRVLVAVESSADAGRVVEAAIEEARRRHVAVDLIHVRETHVVADDAIELESQTDAERLLAAQLQTLRDAGIEADGAVVSNVGRHVDVGRRIIEFATRRDAHLIVLGPRRHRGLAESLVGDVTAEIVRHAPADVLIVAPRQSEAA